MKKWKYLSIAIVIIGCGIISFIGINKKYSSNVLDVEGNYNIENNITTNEEWGWPTISNYIITSRIKWRWGHQHTGIDISGANFYNTPVYSSTYGVVIDLNDTCEDIGSYGNECGDTKGNYIVIKTSEDFQLIYTHLMHNLEVKVNDNVTKGQVIGYVGSSGSSTGTHLHFEIKNKDNSIIDPCNESILNC